MNDIKKQTFFFLRLPQKSFFLSLVSALVIYYNNTYFQIVSDTATKWICIRWALNSTLKMTEHKNLVTFLTEEIMETDPSSSEEAELTSLSWLQSLDITSASSLPTPPCSPSPPPTVRCPPKKVSPLLKAELGYYNLFYLNFSYKQFNYMCINNQRTVKKIQTILICQ